MTSKSITIAQNFIWSVPILSVEHPDWSEQNKLSVLKELLTLQDDDGVCKGVFEVEGSESLENLKQFLAFTTLNVAKKHAQETWPQSTVDNWQLAIPNSRSITYSNGDYELYSHNPFESGWSGIFCVDKDNSNAVVTFIQPFNIPGQPLELASLWNSPDISLEAGKLILYPSFLGKMIKPLDLDQDMTIVEFNSIVFVQEPADTKSGTVNFY